MPSPNYYPNLCGLSINTILWHSFVYNVQINAQDTNPNLLDVGHYDGVLISEMQMLSNQSIC